MEKNEQKPPDIEELLKELSIKVERVKQLYEQYFMGIEKMEPQVARKEVTRALLLLQQQYIRNAGLRFKFNALLQKWNIYITYWNRILREIENGTYTRHLAKAARAAAREGKTLPDELLRAARNRPASGTFDTRHEDKAFLDQDSDIAIPKLPMRKADEEQTRPEFDLETVQPITPPPSPSPLAVPRRAPPPIPPPRAAPPPSPPPIPGMSEGDLRALHQKYVDARKQSGESANVAYETLVRSLAKQVPAVLSQPGVKSVRFDVTVKDGKAILKAIPQKK